MTLSTRRAQVSKRQVGLLGNARISKSNKSEIDTKAIALEFFALEVQSSTAAKATKPVKAAKPAKAVSKRKRVEDESETAPTGPIEKWVTSKKPKTEQLPSPPSSQRDDEDSTAAEVEPQLNFRQLSLDSQNREEVTRPTLIDDLVALHKFLLRAFSIHIAHNGKGTPADSFTLRRTMTRLWKKQNVSQEDIQRILAVYELQCHDNIARHDLLKQNKSPFRLTRTGLGDGVRYNIEYVGTLSFDEHVLHHAYEAKVDALCASGVFSVIPNGDTNTFPRLECEVGHQTQFRKEKATLARDEILGSKSRTQKQEPQPTSNPQQPLQGPGGQEMTTQALKARTLSLFDRVRAKHLANSTTTTPTTDEILRHSAIGRIDEIVEILRMKQQQKLSATYMSSAHTSPGKTRGKVSFSMMQLVNDIKTSLSVPIGSEEIKKCIEILANEVAGGWCEVFDMGTVKSVILNGNGMSGVVVKKMLGGEKRCN